MRSRHPGESHDHEARLGSALQVWLPIPFESTCNPITELVFSLRSKRRFGRARLEEAHWVMRTSFEPQSVRCISQPHRFLFHSCTQDFPVAHTQDLDAPFQRDTCAHLSLCIAQIGNSASSPQQDSLECFFPLVGAFACSESSLLTAWFFTWCHRAELHLCLHLQHTTLA